MKQVFQNLQSGKTELLEIPVPNVEPGTLLIQTRSSLISRGTEKMLVDFSKAGYLKKARSQPEKVKMVLDKIKTDGLMATYQSVRQKLDQPMEMGYSQAGLVVDIGDGCNNFRIGDRVISNGNHSEYVVVPSNLCAKVPDDVSNDEACFTVIGAVALQGVRLIKPELGECIVVMGLGLLGQIAVRLLLANGCKVLCLDFDEDKVHLAEQAGAEGLLLTETSNCIERAHAFSNSNGVDAVLITASSISNKPVEDAAAMCRKRGRIVLVGVTGTELPRDEFFKKELSFKVSCSYGPGRYDRGYETEGHDYPIGYVRWTENRNFQAILDMMRSGLLDVKPLISHRYAFEEAVKAYSLLAATNDEKLSLGIVLEYQHEQTAKFDKNIVLSAVEISPADVPGKPIVSFIGAGNYACSVLIPEFKRAGFRLKSIASQTGKTAALAAYKYGFSNASSVPSDVIGGSSDIIVVATRHDTHSGYVCDALNSGKHVFVEKPLAVDIEGLAMIEDAYTKQKSNVLMVGYNRRFSPLTKKMKHLVDQKNSSMVVLMTINAGKIPAEHWINSKSVGGGRIIGEACHFIDLAMHLAGSDITGVQSKYLTDYDGVNISDSVCITMSFADGSLAIINYICNGSKTFPKERIEVFCEGGILSLNNFKSLKGFDWPGFHSMRLLKQNKGQQSCVEEFLASIKQGEKMPISFKELVDSTRIAIEISNQLT